MTYVCVQRNIGTMSKLHAWRCARKPKKMSQTALAERINETGIAQVHFTTICRIEAGTLWPTPALLAAIEKVTRGAVTAADIFADYRAKQIAKGKRITAAE